MAWQRQRRPRIRYGGWFPVSKKAAVPETRFRTLETLLVAVRECQACAAHLPLGPRPVLRARKTARVLIVGQAPGLRVHTTGVPWDDPSGVRLRAWMGVDSDVFYDESRIAIIPMGYCYPGRGNDGDMPRVPSAQCYGFITCWQSCRGLN